MPSPDQSSILDSKVAWFEDMEHMIGHFTSELDSLETSLRMGDERGRTMTEVGFLLLYLRGWKESGQDIIRLAAKCEQLVDETWREENSATSSEFYARRADHYQARADYLRKLALGDFATA
jgi:hypothetical protein